jgi:hypothetical protein
MKVLLKLSVAICGCALAATQAVQAQNSKTFRWDESSDSGCGLGGASLTITRNGTASWRGVVNSIYRDDAYCVTLSFHTATGGRIFAWRKFCSQTLSQRLQVWENNRLTFWGGHYDQIAIVKKRDSC